MYGLVYVLAVGLRLNTEILKTNSCRLIKQLNITDIEIFQGHKTVKKSRSDIINIVIQRRFEHHDGKIEIGLTHLFSEIVSKLAKSFSTPLKYPRLFPQRPLNYTRV